MKFIAGKSFSVSSAAAERNPKVETFGLRFWITGCVEFWITFSDYWITFELLIWDY